MVNKMPLHCEVITEDRRGLKHINSLLAQMLLAQMLDGKSESAPPDEAHNEDILHGQLSDGQVIADGSATLTYDVGQVSWTLEPGDAPVDKVVSLLRPLANRLRFLDEMGALPDKVSPAAESADVSIVPNAFG